MSLRTECLAEARAIVATLEQNELGDPPITQQERIGVVGKCCNIIRELNKAKLVS